MTGQSTISESISITLNEAVGSATISPSGRDVCLAARKGLFIVDLEDPWATPRFLPYYSAIVSDVQWSPHPARAHWVVSTSGDKGLVWNLAAGSGVSPIEHVTLGHERSITDMNWAVFQPDTLATCGIDGNVLAYDLRQGGRRPSLKYCGWRHGATQVKYNRQNPNQLASSHGEYLYIWDDRKGSLPVTSIRAHEQKIYGIDYSRKRRECIVTCSLDHTVKYWNLDGSESIEKPEQTITTTSPVWRARHTPFGDGLVTLPQRSEFSVKMWAKSSPDHEVWKLTGHNDIVREYLWRTQGGNNAEDDDRSFQMVTWGSDQQLLLTPIPPEVLASVGHVPHSPIEVRQTRRNAQNVSYREPGNLPKSLLTAGSPSSPLPLGSSGGPGVSPTAYTHGPMSSAGLPISDAYGATKRTPPAFHTSHGSTTMSGRMPLSATSRYGRSANSGASASSNDGRSPSLGTSPADGKGLYLGDRRRKQGPSPVAEDVREKASTPLPGGAFMTRATGRQLGGQDAVSWMEGVRVVPTAQQQGQATSKPDSSTTRKVSHGRDDIFGDPENGTQSADSKDVVPLHEELTAIARRLQSKVRFEKIAIPTRTLVVALYGPWAASGVSTFMRATFTFPADYPAKPLNVDIERSSSITNKARARLLSGVRGLAGRYANKNKNSLEPCLECLMGGKVLEPEDALDDDADDTLHGELSHFMLQRFDDPDDEREEVDSEEDLERYLANHRNCPLPRRAGAVFSPNGVLFSYYPLDSITHYPSSSEKRTRSVSPADGSIARPRRRRLFESFGVIPSLQTAAPEGADQDEEAANAAQDEDSDEILNIPSLIMTRRGRSNAGSESIGTSQNLGIKLAGTGRAFNSRIYRYDFNDILGVDNSLAGEYTLQGDLFSIITANNALAQSVNAPWLVQKAWSSLMALAEASTQTTEKGHRIRGLFLGELTPERLFMDVLDVFFRLGDVQMMGLLACLVELDRRSLEKPRSKATRKFNRSPGGAAATDYFSLKPMTRAHASGGSSGGQAGQSRLPVTTPTSAGLPLKSPKDWLISTSYGTQASSGGSSTRGSSWANNLSTFFKGNQAGSDKGNAAGGGRNTPPSAGYPGQPSPASLSPAFVKRSTMQPLSEIKREGGITSGRPQAAVAKQRATPHVSFANAAQEDIAPTPKVHKVPQQRKAKIVIRQLENPDSWRPESLLLHPQVQAQLEYYRLLYADLLHRLGLPHLRTQVLKTTRAARDGTNQQLMRNLAGMDGLAGQDLAIDLACQVCSSRLSGRHPPHCSWCQRKRNAAPCAICHLPLEGLVETCLSCLHTCHLACLRQWRLDEVMCPSACGCSCTTSARDTDPADSIAETLTLGLTE